MTSFPGTIRESRRLYFFFLPIRREENDRSIDGDTHRAHNVHERSRLDVEEIEKRYVPQLLSADGRTEYRTGWVSLPDASKGSSAMTSVRAVFVDVGRGMANDGGTKTIARTDEESASSRSAVTIPSVPFWQAKLIVHVYQLNDDGPGEECLSDDQEVSSLSQWCLPEKQFEGLWDTLMFDGSGVKERLLRYATTAMQFANVGVDKNIISINRVVLLHGPPGTGKTTLCKALAQKLAIRTGHLYNSSYLLEINAHSLFSKWFSESGKLVMKLFEHILELVEEEDSLVCILIDEVESLSAARKSAASGNEPSDAIRVVNALLTQIDRLRTKDNVLILTTSNITEAIDVAFVDRADIKEYVGLPNVRARYEILRSCVNELMRVGLVCPATRMWTWDERAARGDIDNVDVTIEGNDDDVLVVESNLLIRVSQACEGLSGRALRKLPLQAHSAYVHRPDCRSTLREFLRALFCAAKDEQANRKKLVSG